MRYGWILMAMLVGCLCTVGSPAVAGAAVLTDDGYGVRIGAADAPVQLEIFCEPQCPVCKRFEGDFGDQLTHEVAAGRVAITYRWLTFLDGRRDNDTSARVGNALILAADPATVPVAYQNFVRELYRNQDPKGEGTTAEDIAAMARASGVPGPVADRIAAGEPAVDTAAMDTANHDLLAQADPENQGTPTVYDLNTRTVADTDDPGWLDRLIQAG